MSKDPSHRKKKRPRNATTFVRKVYDVLGATPDAAQDGGSGGSQQLIDGTPIQNGQHSSRTIREVQEASVESEKSTGNTAITMGFAARREPGQHRRGHRGQALLTQQRECDGETRGDEAPVPVAPLDRTDDDSMDVDSGVADVDNGVADVNESDSDDEGPMRRKRKNVLHEWLPYRDRILDELHRFDGLLEDACAQCKDPLTPGNIYRCVDCVSQCPMCANCMRLTHGMSPLHRIQTWKDLFWAKTQLHTVGLVLYLFHPDGVCANAQGSREMMVISSTGIHTVNVVFCNCMSSSDGAQAEYVQLLRMQWFPATPETCRTAVTFECLSLFHHLTLQGKLTGYDYYLSLVRLGDNTDIDPPPKRYDEFMRVCRLWRHLKMLRRAGVAVRSGGVNAVKNGECAVQCPACPNPSVAPRPLVHDKGVGEMLLKDTSFLDVMFVMLDANFRLKNKDRPKIRNDFPIGSGMAYYVADAPYKEYLANCPTQSEINICDSGLHAVDHANTRGNDKYLATGVGAAQCKHMLVRPNGVGDLQKGEKYDNIDYVFWSAVVGTPVRAVTISYDIACQWHRNFAKRVSGLPLRLRVKLSDYLIKFVIPKFHIAAHGKPCQSVFSLNYRRGSCRVDGENIERGWAWMNPASLSTREMGPGARQDTLDDQWSSWNWRILVRLGSWLQRRLLESVVEAREHRKLHSEFTETFTVDKINAWSTLVDVWNEDPLQENVKDPYQEPDPEVTLADVRRELNAEDDAELEAGIMPPHQTSASRFIVLILELEEQQRAMKLAREAERDGRTNSRTLAMDDKESMLRRKIKLMQVIQQAYMPGITNLRPVVELSSLPDQLGSGLDNDNEESGFTQERAYDIQLYPPSALNQRERASICVPGLVEKERRLRLAQAEDALVNLRKNLRIGATIFDRKHLHTAGTGTRPNTRMQSLQDRYKKKELLAAHRYIAAWTALSKLHPGGVWTSRLRELNILRDVRPPIRGQDEPSEGRRTLSWIWRVSRAGLDSANVGTSTSASSAPSSGVVDAADIDNTDNDTDNVNAEAVNHDIEEGLRVEWCKSLARAERWEEEVLAVREEMRRILVHLDHKARMWREEAAQRQDTAGARVAAGIRAYAEKQAHLCESLATDFAALWLLAIEDAGLEKPVTWPARYLHAVSTPKRVQRRRTRTKLIQRAHRSKATFNPLIPSDNETDNE